MMRRCGRKGKKTCGITRYAAKPFSPILPARTRLWGGGAALTDSLALGGKAAKANPAQGSPPAVAPWSQSIGAGVVYINRAMPMAAPHTLSADDVYALTAYILSLNDLVPPDFVADRNSLPKVKMRNRDNFI
jgi:hypothetical protein